MNAIVKVNWSDTGHEIEGFGVFAGRAEPFFSDKNRDIILEKLFSEQHLNLNIIRGEILHTFSVSEDEIDFHLDANIDVKPGDTDYPAAGSDDIQQRGQLWILKKALQRYRHINKIIASAWTPPLYMKYKQEEQAKWFNYLKPEYQTAYANYIAEFVKQFTQSGIPIYAISPMNEPEFFNSVWEGCFWDPLSIPPMLMALKKAFQDKNVTSKIIACENANWSYSNIYLSLIMEYFKLFNDGQSPLDIFASHGYTTFLNNPGDMEITPPDWVNLNNTLPRWITESCSTTEHDTGMKMGLKLAESIHNFVFNQRVSAYIYWLGVVHNGNESLINSDGSRFSFNKTYDVMGHFSRYIKPGFVSLKTSTDQPQKGVLLSAWRDKQGKAFTAVVINKNENSEQVVLNPGQTMGPLTPYLTTAEEGVRWQKGNQIHQNNEGEYLLTIAGKSLMTVVS